MFHCLPDRLLLRYTFFGTFCSTFLTRLPLTDNPTPKFGEALRAQVEERLAFFETGAPPSKNADAIRKVLDQLALDDANDDGEDEEMAEPILTLLEPEPISKKVKKNKRKSEEMDVDGEEDDAPQEKKAKLSKEEKKALKKAKKEARVAEEQVSVTTMLTDSNRVDSLRSKADESAPKKKEKKEKRKKAEA